MNPVPSRRNRAHPFKKLVDNIMIVFSGKKNKKKRILAHMVLIAQRGSRITQFKYGKVPTTKISFSDF